MKNKKSTLYLKSFLLIIVGLIITGCPINGNFSNGQTLPTGFYVLDDSERYFVVRNVSKVYTGTYCAIYSDDEINLTEAQAQAIATQFDGTIYGEVTGKFATPYDVNSDSKTAIVVYHGSNGSSYTAGYFNPNDFYKRSFSNLASNEMDVIYINGAPSNHEPWDTAFYITVAHEFQHLTNHSENVIRRGKPAMPTWINEGMSENASALTYTRSTYESEFKRMYSFQTDYYARTGNFSMIYWNSQIINYSVSYAFFAYLHNKYATIYQDMYQSTGSSTETLNTLLQAEGSSLNDEFTSFVHDLKNQANFPAGFFPGGFSVQTTSSNTTLYPYGFVYTSAGKFTNENTELTYLNGSGTVITGAASVTTNGVAALYITGSSVWGYNTLSAYVSGSNVTQQTYSSSIISASSFSAPISTAPVQERRLDLDLDNITIKPEYDD